jgi:hypothetical protein
MSCSLKLVDSVLGNRRPRTAQHQSLGRDEFATVAFLVHKPVDHLTASISYFSLVDFCHRRYGQEQQGKPIQKRPESF